MSTYDPIKQKIEQRSRTIRETLDMVENVAMLYGELSSDEQKPFLEFIRKNVEACMYVNATFLTKSHPDRQYKFDQSKIREAEAAEQLAKLEEQGEKN